MSLNHISKYNENAVIHALRRLGPTSQSDIAAATNLSVQTVSAIARQLTGRGYLREVETVSGGRGRPRVILDLIPTARYAAGIHVDPSVISATILDLRGSVVACAQADGVDAIDPEASLDAAAGLLRGVAAEAGLSVDTLVGSCLAVPGPLNVNDAVVNSIWLPGWDGFDLRAGLRSRLGMDVPVVKDTLAAVIGENWVRAGDALEATLVFVYVGTGTGVGLCLNGEPVRGFSGNAGEVGRLLVALDAREDRVASGLSNDPALLVEVAYRRGVLGGAPPLRGDGPALDRAFRQLCSAAAGGDLVAVDIVEAAARRIAELAVISVELLDANLVVFGGPYWELVRPWYKSAVVAGLARPSARGPHPVEVHSSAMGSNVGAIGAAAVVLDERYVPRAPRG